MASALTADLRKAALGAPTCLSNEWRDDIVRRKGRSYLWGWQRTLFAFMYRNSIHAADRFDLPPKNVIEIARQIEI